MKAIFAALLFLACFAAAAQDYSGTFFNRTPQGNTVTLSLKQQGNQVSGTLSGNNNNFSLQGQVNANGLVGTLASSSGTLFIAAERKGETLNVILAEPGPTGQPNLQAARQLVFNKELNPGKKDEAPQASGTDEQARQFLTANAWCGFTYNKTSGTSTTERIVFSPNGTVSQTSGRETYTSGYAGTVAGQYSGAQQGRWRVQQGELHLSQDGVNWSPQPLVVTRNSNGSPIIKSGGKEYMVCR